MPEIKWQVQLTYEVLDGESDKAALEERFTVGWDDTNILVSPDLLVPGAKFTVESERLDRFGPINVIQIFNMDCKSAINRAGLHTELVRIDLDAPGTLPPAKLEEPPRAVVRELIRDYYGLMDMTNPSVEELQNGLVDLGYLIKLLENDTPPK